MRKTTYSKIKEWWKLKFLIKLCPIFSYILGFVNIKSLFEIGTYLQLHLIWNVRPLYFSFCAFNLEYFIFVNVIVALSFFSNFILIILALNYCLIKGKIQNTYALKVNQLRSDKVSTLDTKNAWVLRHQEIIVLILHYFWMLRRIRWYKSHGSYLVHKYSPMENLSIYLFSCSG